ncbi:MAG: bifunctional phosphoglucose/phosphomannose isomerase [Actinobacteria bacterium]|nr:bifunctional phosphoglucose/phosphomannose isomerase [Actinomycetota bacterium]
MSDMLTQIKGLASQLRWAAEIDAPSIGTHSEVLCVGMGGSGISGDYAAAIAEPFGTRVSVHKGYGPVPPWAIRLRPLVVAVSYSGNTEETLDFTVSARDTGLPVAVVTTGGRLGKMAEDEDWAKIDLPAGLQPRAALGYLLGAALRVLEGAHAVDDQRLAFVEAAEFAGRAVEEGSDTWKKAEEIAGALSGRIPIIYGGGPISGVVAQRWKTQINENAKMPAWWSVLPELDHNEITSWETMPEVTKDLLGVVALTDRGDHDRVASRIDFTRDLTSDAVPWVGQVGSSGTFPLTRLVSLTVTGDLVSLLLAEQAGVDPVPVNTIEKLKKLLAKEDE